MANLNLYIFTLCIVFLLTIFTATAETNFSDKIPSDLKDIVIPISDDNAHLLDQGTWFVDVYAPWCGYCAQVFPTIIESAKKVKENLNFFPETKFAIIDGTLNPELNNRFVKGGYPSLIIKNVNGQTTQFARTTESILRQLQIMAQPPVSPIRDRGHLQRLLGTTGKWENIFIYLGANINHYREFQQCASIYQGIGRFFSPYGYQDEQQIQLSQSIWLSSKENWDKLYDLVGTEAKNALEDLTDLHKIDFQSLPVVINEVVGRPTRIFTGPWDSGSEKAMCGWVESNLKSPIEALAPYNFQQITEKNEQFLLFAIPNVSEIEMTKLAILPPIANTNRGLFDTFTWTASGMIPRLRQHYQITADEFILVVNRHLGKYWVLTEISSEEKIQEWLKKIQTDPSEGKSLYHWANIITPLVRDLTRWGERFTPDHAVFLLGLACASIFVGLSIGVIIVCFCMEPIETKIARLKAERAAVEAQTNSTTSSNASATGNGGPRGTGGSGDRKTK